MAKCETWYTGYLDEGHANTQRAAPNITGLPTHIS